MTFHIPSLRELRIVFDENDSEYIIFDEFKAFLKNNKCGDEPAIKSGNIFSWLKGKDHSVKSVEGKPSFKLESIVQYCMSYRDTYEVCRQVTKEIKGILVNQSEETRITSTKEIYKHIANADFLSKVILSELKIEESDITTLNSFYKNEFTEESWRKICFFEMHFMREGDFKIESDTYETTIMKKTKFLSEMQQAHQLAGTIMEQSRNEILERTKRREHAEMGERICISGKNTHSPSIIESQVMNAMPDQCFLNTIVLSDCTSHCTHNKSLHVHADISEDSQASIPDIKTIISSYVKTNHKETCSEFVFFSGTIKKYKDSSGEYMRFKLRDDFLSGRLNESVLYHWKSYDCDTDSIFEDTDETCQCCYGTPQTKPLSTKSFNVLWEWYIETPLVCQILFEIFINQRSLKRAEETKQFLKKKYTRLYMQYDSFLNILNKRYCGILQDKSTQELSMNYHSLSAVFNLTSAGGLTQSLTTAEQKLKDMANSEKTYLNTYLKKYALTYETIAGESTEKVCLRDCVLVLMMDNLVRLKKHADPDPGESRSMQICTLPITIKGIPKDALECVNWHDADCEACVDIICKCKQDKVLNSSDVDNLLIHLTTKQQSGFNDFKKLVTFGYSDIWKAVLKEKMHLLSPTRQESDTLDKSFASLQMGDVEEDEDLQELSHIGVDVITETDEIEIEPDAIEELESIQLDRSINDGQPGTDIMNSTLDDSLIFKVHSDVEEDIDVEQHPMDYSSTVATEASVSSTRNADHYENRVLSHLGFKKYNLPPLLSRHPPPAVGRDDDIQKLKEILDDVLVKTDNTKETSNKILFAPDHKIAVNLLKLRDTSKKYERFLPEFPALHLRKSKITILCSAYKDAGVLHILKYMRDEDFQEWRKLISADHIEMGTKYIRRLSTALHLAFFIVFLQKYHADKKEVVITDVLDSKNIDAHWMSFTSFLEEGSRRNGTFALHRDIMTHCDEVCAIAFAERLGGPQGYNLLLAAVKSSLPFSFLNGASSYAAFTTKLLHEYYKSGIYYQNMKHSLFSTPNRGSEVNFALDTQREMDHKDALKAFRSGSTVASVLPRMSLIDVLDDTHERTAHSKIEKTQEELLGFSTTNTDEKYIVRILSLILRQGGICLDEDEKVYNVYDNNKTVLSPAVLDSETKELGQFLIKKYAAQEGLFGTSKSDIPNVNDVAGPKQLLQKVKSTKGVTIRRMFAKVDTETKTDRDRREDVRKKTVKKQLQRFDCLSSEMNACQAIVKPDCTKPKVLKSSGMKNALVKTVHEAISNTNEENNNILEEHNLIFLSKRSIPKPVMETASHATIEFAGVKFKTNASSGQQYLKYIENGVIKKTQLQLPNVQELAICEEKYQFTPDDFKAATRSQRVSKKAYSVTHLKTSEEMLSSETFHKNSIVTTPQGKSLISTYLARNIHKIKVQKPITISIDSELHMSNCSCPEHPKCCCCPRYAHPICAKMYADKEPDIDILTYIKQTKGEAEMSQVDWLTEYQDRLLDGNACVSIVTSGDIDAVVIHMFALSHGWPRTSDGKFKNSVFVILQKPVGLYDTYHVTGILTALEEKWNDKNIGMKLAVVLSMAGNDFLPKLHGISHTKTVEVFLQYPHLRSSLFDFEHPSDCTIHVKLNPDIYTELIKYLYCAKKLNADDFSFDEIRQMSILPVNAKSLEDYRNPQLWMPPISTIEKMSKNVQCLIDYYLTAGDHSKQMPNFLLCGSLTKTDKGEIEFDLGPDSHINRIGECVVTDPGELALRLRKKGKRKPEETPQKGRRRKLRPQAQSTPRKNYDD